MSDGPAAPSLRIRDTVELLSQQSRLLPKSAPQARVLLDAVSRSLPYRRPNVESAGTGTSTARHDCGRLQDV